MRAFWIIIALLIAATAALCFTGGRDSDEQHEAQPVADRTQQADPEPIAPSSPPAVAEPAPPAPEASTDQPAPAQPEAAQPEPDQPEPVAPDAAQPEPIAHNSALDALKQAITNPNQNADPQPGTNMPRPEEDTTENQTGPGSPVTETPAPATEEPDAAAAPEPEPEPETETDPEPAPASPTTIAPEAQPQNIPAATPAEQPEPTPANKPESVVKTDTGLLLNGHWIVPGSGTKADPYKIDWDMLVAVQQDYKPRLGQDKIPDWINALNGKTVTIRGYALLPTGMATLSELLVMLNEWDSCCIGVPPTPYDAIEVRLAEPLNNSAKSMFSHTGALSFGDITGTFKIDPYIVQGWLLGLYLMEDASTKLIGPAGTP